MALLLLIKRIGFNEIFLANRELDAASYGAEKFGVGAEDLIE